MQTVINAKTLRGELKEILERVRKGERFTVLYRSYPVCQIVPMEEQGKEMKPLEDDPLYGRPGCRAIHRWQGRGGS